MKNINPSRKPAPSSGKGTGSRKLHCYSFRLRYHPPLDWDALIDFLGPRAIPGIEAVEAGVYQRTIELSGYFGRLEVRPGGPNALRLMIEFPKPAPIPRIVARVRRMFDFDADPPAINAHLMQDRVLAPLVTRRPGLRVPRAWDGFELGVRAILGQQVSVAAATTLSGRLAALLGRRIPESGGGLTHLFPSPQKVARWNAAGIGIPRKRAEAIRLFAAAVQSGDLAFGLDGDTGVFRQRMCAIHGIGSWTAEYVALRGLGDPDAFPAGDLGLLRAAKASTPRELLRRAERWRPWRAYAAVHLWTAGNPHPHRSVPPESAPPV